MGLFDKARSKVAERGNDPLGIKKLLGEEPKREFVEYSSFPQYVKEEPRSWSPMQGEGKCFSLSGATIMVSKELDTCIQYRGAFAEAASYYTERFKYKYSLCVSDYDSFTHYFSEMYSEGLQPMLYRSYSLLLPLGIFDIDNKSFNEDHASMFSKAVLAYQTMCGIEDAGKQKKQAIVEGITSYGMLNARLRDVEDKSVSYRDFVTKDYLEETFLPYKRGELSSMLLGRVIANAFDKTPEQKAAAFAAFETEPFFEAVYSDYYNSFYTLIFELTQKGLINGVKVINDGSAQTMIDNLKNPLFPKDRIPQALATIISTFPFEKEYYTLAEELCGSSSEIITIKNYFLG